MTNTIQTNEQMKEARREAQRLELLKQHLSYSNNNVTYDINTRL